jgi:cyclic lactone autoinducer peptide
MNFLFESISNVVTNISMGASVCCALLFFESEVPKSLREE